MNMTQCPSADNLANNIRALRKRLGMSQEEFACKVGLNRGNIASYEKGTAEPKICNLIKIAHFFSVSIIDLLQKDLRCDKAFAIAGNNFHKISSNEHDIIDQFAQNSDELNKVLQCFKILFAYKKKSLEESTPELQAMVVNFGELLCLTQTLMEKHAHLIEYIRFQTTKSENVNLDSILKQ